MENHTDVSSSSHTLSLGSRLLILTVAFLGWMFGGVQLSITSFAMRSAAIDLLDRTEELDKDQFKKLLSKKQIIEKEHGKWAKLPNGEEAQLDEWRTLSGRWFGYYQCALLFGAAAGGFAFGRLGDRIGRSRAMAASILCYSVFSGAAYIAAAYGAQFGIVFAPIHLLILRFLASMGVGGMWPNGVALVSEAWSNLSRPMVAGIMGTSANVGILLMGVTGLFVPVTPEDWYWVLLLGTAPVFLGIFSLALVPESPRWLSSRTVSATGREKPATGEVFRSPLLPVTLVGIALATIPLFGAWGGSNWMMPWAGERGAAIGNEFLKAWTMLARSLPGVIGSLLGGWIGSLLGRRRAYMLVSLGALFCAQFAFWFTDPSQVAWFLFWVAALGFFSGIYFGWLPLFLPELFPTRVRSTGAGVSFNFGRILTAFTIFATSAVMEAFGGKYAYIGRVTSLIYAVGIIAIWFAPDTTKTQLED